MIQQYKQDNCVYFSWNPRDCKLVSLEYPKDKQHTYPYSSKIVSKEIPVCITYSEVNFEKECGHCEIQSCRFRDLKGIRR